MDLADLRPIFGDGFLTYVLNGDPATLIEADLGSDQQQGISLLDQLAQTKLVKEDRSLDWDYVAMLVQGGYMSKIRQAFGGTSPATETNDEVERLIQENVIHLFPLLLLPVSPSERSILSTGVESAAVSCPGIEALAAAILRDDALRQLFLSPDYLDAPDPGHVINPFKIHADLYWRGGGGGTTFGGILAARLVSFGVVMAGLNNQISLDAVYRYASQGLRIARTLSTRQSCEIPVAVTFLNVEFSEDLECFETAWGVVRRATPFAAAALLNIYAPTNIPPRAIFMTVGTENLEYINYRWPTDPGIDGIKRNTEQYFATMESFRQNIDRVVVDLRFSILLASEGQLVAPIHPVFFPINPLGMFRVQPFNAGDTSSPALMAAITRDLADCISSWALRVKNEYPENLRIGKKRLLAAATSRMDPADGFIDAVMAWENLFGGTPETTFKICASIAQLLEPTNVAKRRSLFEELNKIYSARSNLVHGNSELSGQDAKNKRDRAVHIGLEAMRAAFDYPGLLRTLKSADRNKLIVIGPPSTPTA